MLSTIRFAILLSLTTISSFAAAHGSHERMSESYFPIGIYVGPDHVSAATQSKGGGPLRSLCENEGDKPYQAFMRQDLWDSDRPVSEVRQPGIEETLQTIYSPIPDDSKLESAFVMLKASIASTLKRDPKDAVLGVPVYASKELQAKLREQATNAGFNVLATSRQPALVIEEHGLTAPGVRSKEITLIALSYNSASLDLSLLHVHNGTTTIIAFEADAALGEEALYLTIVKSIASDEAPMTGRILQLLGRQIKSVRARDIDLKDDTGAVDLSSVDFSAIGANLQEQDLSVQANAAISSTETAHFAAIFSKLEDFISQHTRLTDSEIDSSRTPLLSNLNGISFTGDASKRGMLALRRVIAAIPALAELHDFSRNSEPAAVGARGAALRAAQKVVSGEDDDVAEASDIVHEEL